tara:strand:+ start:218 stop:1243 length:1026 start_codon:yes stop_codon:yes gene_type:complete
MLEKAIVDAAALREAALKNAEQAIVEKYAPEIKAAVDSLLESSTKGIVQEQEEAMATSPAPQASIEAPFAVGDYSPNQSVEMEVEFEFNPEDFDIDLGSLQQQAAEEPAPTEDEQTETGDLMADLGLGGDEAPAEEGGDDELALQEIIDIMTEIDQEEVLEEELVVDMGHVKNGTFETNQGTLRYYEEMELAKQESTKVKEENEELNKKIEELKETVEKYKVDNKKLYSAVNELKTKMDESLLSNAKLVYSNKVLSDTSLNERQKDKIVEAIAQAKTLNEAKTLCETLKATVGTTKNNGPKSLSESVQRKSNLSSILPRNKKEINESFTFADKMKKLAGIS